jgi:RNA polymerase sigma-B factor
MDPVLNDPFFDDLIERLAVESDDLEAVREQVLQRGTFIIQEVIETSFSASGFSDDELFRPGYLGLMNAVYNYDLSHGTRFREYAENLIKGEIRHHIRDKVRPMPIPRWMKDLNRQIEMTESKLLRETGNLPTLSELAEAANITEDGLAEIFKARDTMSYVSLNAEQRAHDPVFDIDVSKIHSKQSVPFPVEYRIRLASALERLSDLQQRLLRNLFGSSE